MAASKPDNISSFRMCFWWTTQFISLYFYTIAIISLNKPDIMPIAGGISTIFFYYIYTIKKNKQEDMIKSYHLEISNFIVTQSISNEVYNRRNAESDFLQVNYKISKIQCSLKNIEKDINLLKKDPEYFKKSSIHLYDSRILLRKNPSSVIKPIYHDKIYNSLDSYKETIKCYKKSIEFHEYISSNFSRLEAFGIIYSVIVSTFGSNIVLWWHSSCRNDLTQYLSIFAPFSKC